HLTERDQLVQRVVHGRQADLGQRSPRRFEHLLGAEVVAGFERLGDRAALRGQPEARPGPQALDEGGVRRAHALGTPAVDESFQSWNSPYFRRVLKSMLGFVLVSVVSVLTTAAAVALVR